MFALFDAVQVTMAGALRGMGDVRVPMVINVVCHWLIGLVMGYLLAFEVGLGVKGLWYGITLGLVTASVALAARFLWLSARPIARISVPEGGV